VREALFSILETAGPLEGTKVLDLYAGTGALALEALSRGAAEAVLVESSRDALAVIRGNVASLDLGDRARVIAGDVAAAVRRVARTGPFDVVFADPPWAVVEGGEPARALADLAAADGLASDARVVFEHAARTESPEVDGLVRVDTRRYGDTALTFYKPAILVRLR
jgi:16S rRNA (guanine966-N2)-methyltransferase